MSKDNKKEYRELTQLNRILNAVLDSHILNPCDEDYLVATVTMIEQDLEMNNLMFSLEDKEECDEEKYWNETAVRPGETFPD